MAPVEPGSKDLRVLQIDRSQKDALDQKDKGNRGPFLYAVVAVLLLVVVGLVFCHVSNPLTPGPSPPRGRGES